MSEPGAVFAAARPVLRGRGRDGSAGYTVVEVLMALAVLAVGATGIIAMQKAALIGNTRARNLTTASTIASAWLDRLKLDALWWRKATNGTSTINKTRWLKVVGEDFPTKTGDEGTWMRPALDMAAGYSPLADVRGVDLTDENSAHVAFCTHVRLTQLMPTMLRAEVRVFWLKNQGSSVSDAYAGTINGNKLCASDGGYVGAVGAATNRYHFVYMSAAVLQSGANL
jgi:type IV pilus assembly protein PilV